MEKASFRSFDLYFLSMLSNVVWIASPCFVSTSPSFVASCWNAAGSFVGSCFALSRACPKAASAFLAVNGLLLRLKDEDIVVMAYPNYGVKMYGNAIIASDAFVKQHPDAIKGFLRAFAKASKDVMANPDAAVAAIKARDALVDEKLEARRLKLTIASSIATANARRILNTSASGIQSYRPGRPSPSTPSPQVAASADLST